MKHTILNTLGVASGIAANNPGCAEGPGVLQQSKYLKDLPCQLDWQKIFTPNTTNVAGSKTLPILTPLLKQVAEQTLQWVKQKKSFLVFGGDHSCAIGTWSGAAVALQNQGPIGLIWIDAHMDSHTNQTTKTNNVHGMPLAALLGHGHSDLINILSKQPKLQPQHICLIGVRSFESEEVELLKKLNVKVFYMEEVQQRGMKAVMQDALEIVKNNTAGFGVSLDLDAIDPTEAPGVGVPEKNGLTAQDLCNGLSLLQHEPNLLGLEIVEFNPQLDQQQKTEKLVGEIITSVFT
jgi:arginase